MPATRATSTCSGDEQKPDFDTFDVIRYSVGEGTNQVDLVEALVEQALHPQSTVAVMRGGTANQDSATAPTT